MSNKTKQIFSVVIISINCKGDTFFQPQGNDFDTLDEAVTFGQELKDEGSDVYVIPMIKI